MATTDPSKYSLDELRALRNKNFTKLQKAEYQLMIRCRINGEELEEIKAICQEIGQIDVELKNRENP